MTERHAAGAHWLAQIWCSLFKQRRPLFLGLFGDSDFVAFWNCGRKFGALAVLKVVVAETCGEGAAMAGVALGLAGPGLELVTSKRALSSAPCSSSSSSSSCLFSASSHAKSQKPLALRSSFVARTTHSSFWDGGVGACVLALAVEGSSKQSSRGGALCAQANIFERVVRIVKSYANAIVSAAEDPEKLLDQTVTEMNDDLIKMRQASAQVLASQKQLENKYKASQTTADDWYRRAKLALEKGDEVLAREALKRRKDYEESAKALKTQLDQQKNVVEKLISNTRLLESKIQEAKSKKDTLKARAQSAKTSQKVNELLGGINSSGALAAFEKMEEKVNSLEAQSEALNQLSTDDLASKFALLESDSVDDDLASLKQDMLGTSKRKGELPEGRSQPVSSSSTTSPFKDLEIERELNDLRSKTTDF